MDFNDWAKSMNLRILPIADERYGPGAIINENVLFLEDSLSDALGRDFEIVDEDAAMPGLVLSARQKVQSGFNLLGIVSISGNVSNDVYVEYNVTKIHAKTLKNAFSAHLHLELMQLHQTNKPLWDEINDCIVVMEAYYASAFDVTFKSGSTAGGTLDIKGNVNLSASANATWETDQKITVRDNETVPFGVRGFAID